uniref:Uncharacterized protein n=1 Tax=Chromera velia CCMP2878 TaxID=1169474 RepID=A0A0G4GY58_9ALVE|eukprot:Cvel_5386.t1-p1 / transcript=Cvel_5386.t1 / gene=Cvel_5386 / organism=Chromera_velia_CCMP2878 / gene_product=hypothetical protein / transcript_product=hypothetical protein / location=Cvel_scaffold250:87064-90672(-) / protein_length=436 / sequence_SO=supercontig / SO=protein_coding / is_pseudo=false
MRYSLLLACLSLCLHFHRGLLNLTFKRSRRKPGLQAFLSPHWLRRQPAPPPATLLHFRWVADRTDPEWPQKHKEAALPPKVDGERPEWLPHAWNLGQTRLEPEEFLRGDTRDIPVEPPSSIDPKNPALRTGRRRDIHRRNDTGQFQKLRWDMDAWLEDDIPRGYEIQNDTWNERLNSIDWERTRPVYYDKNFYKRTYVETGFQQHSENKDSFFDIQLLGNGQHFPCTDPVGANFTWTVNWIPFERKKRFKNPIKSPPVNWAGVEPVQLWFFPDGHLNSIPGYCALKLMLPPGWELPFEFRLRIDSEYNGVESPPLRRATAEYTKWSNSFCKIIDQKTAHQQGGIHSDQVLMGPAGNVQIHLELTDPNQDWDDGLWEMEYYMKQNAEVTRDRHVLPSWLTHSEWFEAFKYRDLPDRHWRKYMTEERDPTDPFTYGLS